MRALLEAAYPDETFRVEDRVLMSGERSLLVGLLNSEYARLEPEPKQSVAYGVAKLAFDTHPKAGELTHVSVRFTTVTKAGPFSNEESSVPIRFTPKELTGKEAS